MNIRKAELQDVPALFKLISRYVLKQILLPRPLTNLYEDVWEFTVAEENGKLLGCGALKFINAQRTHLSELLVVQLERATSEKLSVLFHDGEFPNVFVEIR